MSKLSTHILLQYFNFLPITQHLRNVEVIILHGSALCGFKVQAKAWILHSNEEDVIIGMAYLI